MVNDFSQVLEPMSFPLDDHYRALSYRFRVRSDLDGAGSVIRRLFASFRVDSKDVGVPVYTLTWRLSEAPVGDGERRYELFKDGVSVNRVANPGSLLDWVIGDFSKRAVQATDRFLAVHAGVVARDDVAAILPAPPDSGKTTLTAGLTRAGFRFLSDEVAAIDPETALVHPFPRPVLMDPESMDVMDGLEQELPPAYEAFRLRRYHLAPDDLRHGALGGVCRIGVVVVPTYRAGAHTRLEPMGRAEALFHLSDSNLNLDRFGRGGFEVLATLARECPAYRLSIGDLREAVETVGDLLPKRIA